MTAVVSGSFMTAETVLAGLLEPGDVICVHHHHDSRCGDCLAPWQIEAVITGRPAPVFGRLVVSWAAGSRRTRFAPCGPAQPCRAALACQSPSPLSLLLRAR